MTSKFLQHDLGQIVPGLPLTERQRHVLVAIYMIRLFTGRGPTFFELRSELGCTSNNAIESFLATLERKGVIRRVMVEEQDDKNRWRMREITLTPEGRRELPFAAVAEALHALVNKPWPPEKRRGLSPVAVADVLHGLITKGKVG